MRALCQCGCGLPAPLAKKTDRASGRIEGQPQRFRLGHSVRRAKRWRAEDRGYLTPCHIWLLHTNAAGYGTGRDAAGAYLAHRRAWEDANGPITDGLVVCHRCDQPACVNVAHLFLGRQADNVADMVAKLRSPRGERNGSAKLRWDEIPVVKSMVAAGATHRAVAAVFDVNPSQITRIVNEKSWKGAPEGVAASSL